MLKWGDYWAGYLRQRAVAAGVGVQITDMRRSENIRSADHAHIFDRPALYDFVDISQNNAWSGLGQGHYDNLLFVRERLAARPRPINNNKIQKATARGMTVDGDLIVLTPDAPMLEIYRNAAGWNRNRSRCKIDGPVLFRAPVPPDFIVSPDTWDGLTPNSGLAGLMPDGRTIQQTQPFARCKPDHGTSRFLFDDQDLYGMGYYGAHGGSGLSCIGGTLRVGELVPDAGPIRHALKVNIYAARND